MEMDINMKNHQAYDTQKICNIWEYISVMIDQINTQLRFTQMQSYKCNEGVCVQKDIDALNNETQACEQKLNI